MSDNYVTAIVQERLEAAQALAKKNAEYLKASWRGREQERVWIRTVLRDIAECGKHGMDVAALRVAVRLATNALADMTRWGGTIPLPSDPNTPGEETYADRIEKLTWRAEVAEAKAAVVGGEACAENRAAGRGPCGACAWCCQQATERAEKAELELSTKRDALAVTLMNAGPRLAELATETELVKRECTNLRKMLTDIRDHAHEALEPDEDNTAIVISRGRGHTVEEDWRDTLQVIRDWISEKLPWPEDDGASYTDRWLMHGYRVEWSEREPRMYEVRRVGCSLGDNDCLARLATVQEVDEWIRKAGPMAEGEEGRAGRGSGLESG